MNRSKVEKTKAEVMTVLSQGKDSTILFEANQLDDKTSTSKKHLAEKEQQ